MALLKEDGSLDIERINKLPLEEHIKEIGSLSQKQYREFLASLPLYESHGHTKTIMVDVEEALNKGLFVDADEVLNNIKRQLDIE